VMTDLAAVPVAPAVALPAAATDRLDRLVARIAAGDRPAFRCLYAFLAVRVWHTAARTLPHPGHAVAVTRSTFLEVWHTAGVAGRDDARDWIDAITAFRVDERRRLISERGRPGPESGTAGLGEPATDVIDDDNRVHRELADVLGTGRAIIRVGPATFVRIEDLARGWRVREGSGWRRARSSTSARWPTWKDADRAGDGRASALSEGF
jgi:hypothetical protein